MNSTSENILVNFTEVAYSIIGSTSVSGEFANTTSNVTTSLPDLTPPHPIWEQVLISGFLGILIVGTIIGNFVVCTAVALVKTLQTPYNFMIVSLALSDLLVAILVMPFAAMYEVIGYWPLSDIVCDIWTSLDVTLCTASILNLCMISVDRYFVITRPFTYAVKRTPRRIVLMITGVWSVCAVISIPPLFGWKTPNPPNQCGISQELGYQIYATLGAFYLPLAVMIVVYVRIWKVASRLANHETENSKVGTFDRGVELTTLSNSTKSNGTTTIPKPNGTTNYHQIPNVIVTTEPEDSSNKLFSKTFKAHKRTLKTLLTRPRTRQPSVTTSSIKRKTTKSLGVIMGCFVVCWLPFFILAVIRPLVDPEHIPRWLNFTLTWLGYLNSFLNPLIYVRYNRDFRTPFKEILCCHCRNIDASVRSKNYAEQYGPDQGTRLV